MGNWTVVIHGVGSHDTTGGIENDVAEFVKAETAKGQQITHVVVAGSAVHTAQRHEHGVSHSGKFTEPGSGYHPAAIGEVLK